MGGDATGTRPHRSEPRHRAEEEVGHAVDGPSEFFFDAVHDDGSVGGNRGSVIADEKRTTLLGNLLEAFPLHPEPAFVHGRVEAPDDLAHALGPTPFVDVL